jgi:hypothetical protein
MKQLLTILLLLPTISFSQKFFVIEPDKRINERISNRILELGYSTTKDRDKSDFVAQMIYEKKHAYLTFKTGYQKEGYIAFLNKKGDTLAKTALQGGQAWGYNTYTSLSTLTNKILKTDFNKVIKSVVTDSHLPGENSLIKGSYFPSKADELIKLKKLYDDGVLTQDEFESAKKKLLAEN